MDRTPTLSFCADDYGLAPALSQAIRALIEQGRLQATSCMTGSAYWPDAAKALMPLKGLADIGLHVTLTDQRPLTAMPATAPRGRLPGVDRLIIASHLGRLHGAEIQAEITAQFDAFERHFGQAPDYIDGHQHVHQLPVIRDIVLDLWTTRMGRRGWIRNCWENPLDLWRRRIDTARAAIIAGLGLGLKRRMERLGVPHNLSFRGVYDLTDRIAYPTLMAAFLTDPKPRTLIMVHPGRVDDALRAADPLTDQRERELAYLSSDAFGRELAATALVKPSDWK